MTTRVLICEDSPLFVDALTEVVDGDPRLSVCGVATDGAKAVKLCRELKPDLVTMDVLMPVMDGLDAIGEIMADCPTPILVMTADPRGESGELAVEALRRGALDIIQKPTRWPGTPDEIRAFREQIRLLASISVVRHMAPRQRVRRAPVRRQGRSNRVVAIAASTGGPPALAQVLQDVGAEFPCGIACVQHISAGFAENLASWLNSVSPLDVSLARHGQRVRPGLCLLAPDGHQMRISPVGRVVLDTTPAVDGHRPSGTVLLKSVADSYGSAAIGVVLTGMGRDGAAGLKAIRNIGGATLAQDEATSAVWGMPRSATECGAAQTIAPLDEVGAWLVRQAQRHRGTG